MRGRARVAAAAACLFVLAACNEGQVAAPPVEKTETTQAPGHHSTHDAPDEPVETVPLRAEESRVTLTMPAAYTPKAPTYGTDDYRCFLLDPNLTDREFVTGVDVLPGNPEVVHHVILFQVPPEKVAAAEAEDAKVPGEGWTCFGGTGLDGQVGDGLNQAPWIGAWAPGGGESVMADDIGIPLAPGSRVIMQVHYNLLEGTQPDTSSAVLRMAPGSKKLKPLETMLLVAPIELPCRPGKDSSDLCDRDKAVFDVASRFGNQASFTVAGLQLICGGSTEDPKSGATQRCDRTVKEAATVRAIAGHMHLLGRSITVELNPGTPQARTLLDVEPWNFDEQGSVPVEPAAQITPGDTLRITCRHSQEMRDLLPELENVPERYVVWGEGTTDEMCLGIVLVTP